MGEGNGKKRYQVIDKENARLEEEQYRFETNRTDYEAFTDAIGMGRSYLSRNFSKETGMTLTEYIRKDKMERAAMMIVQNHHSLTEISVFLGYGDYTYFSKLFKKEYGVCPEKYLTSSQLRNQNMHFS